MLSFSGLLLTVGLGLGPVAPTPDAGPQKSVEVVATAARPKQPGNDPTRPQIGRPKTEPDVLPAPQAPGKVAPAPQAPSKSYPSAQR